MNNNVKEYDVKKERMKKYFLDYLGKTKEITINSLENFIYKYLKTCNRSSFYTNITLYNEILNELEIKHHFESSDYIGECVKADEHNFFTKEEIIDICQTFSNAQDRFIVYALWNGINGKEFFNLRNIKLTDIARDDSSININGEIFKCDEYMQKCVRYTRLAYMYQTLGEGVYSYYVFNMDSPFLLKTRCTKKNNDGKNIMTKPIIQQKLVKLTKYYNERYGGNINLSGRNLIKSGVLYKLHEVEQKENITWSISKMDKWLKENGIKMNMNEIYRTYCDLFYGKNSLVEE